MRPLACRLAALSLLGACADGAAPAAAGEEASPLSHTHRALSAGTLDPELMPLGAGPRRALGAFVRDDVVRCTGTLIAPRRVLTAAHCFAHETNLQPFDFVQFDGAQMRPYPLRSVATHPTLDLAVVTLGAEGPPGWRDTALPVRRIEMNPADDVGAAVEAAGAGVGSAGNIRFAQLTVAALTPWQLELSAQAPQGICSGDSGGPVLAWRDGADVTGPPAAHPLEQSPEIIAVLSTSAPNCASPAFAVRLDVAADWLAETLSTALPPPSAPCDDEAAVCTGGDASVCRGGWWHTRDCAADGRFCGALPGGGDGCLPTPCGSVDRRGLCDDGAAVWCGASGLETMDCEARGLGCAFSDADDGVRCLDCNACDGRCVDLASDTSHCGVCGRECAGPGESCLAGACVAPEDPLASEGAPTEPVAVAPATGGGCGVSSTPQAAWAWAVAALLALVCGNRWWRLVRVPAKAQHLPQDR